MFWALYDQGNSTWVLQGLKMSHVDILGLDVGAEQMQSLNPLLIMLFVPVFAFWIYPRIGRWAAPLRRMSVGLFLAAASFVIVAFLQQRIEAGAHLSVLWQAWPWVVITAAEVLVSATGLEFAFREAAPEMKSLIMSFWLLTVAAGNLFVALLTQFLPHTAGQSEDASVSTGRFLLYAAMMFGVAIVFSLIAATYTYRDPAAARGK
jgi:POT family proton-dependent oligopeptide transporter